jgi:hypothetical protein
MPNRPFHVLDSWGSLTEVSAANCGRSLGVFSIPGIELPFAGPAPGRLATPATKTVSPIHHKKR